MNILDRRWMETDQYIIEYINGYQKINKQTQAEVQKIFNGLNITYQDLNKTIEPAEQIIVDEAVKEIKKNDYFVGYFKVRINELYSERMTYKNYIEVMLLIIQIKEYTANIDDIKVLIKKSNESVYNQAVEELKIAYPEIEPKPFSVKQSIVYELIGGYTLLEYLSAFYLTNMQEIMKQTMIDIQQQKELDITRDVYQNIFTKQRNRLIHMNPDTGAVTGGLDPYIITTGNQTYLETSGADTGKPEATNQDKTEEIKVRFIAQHDNKTTPMCKSMDNRVFLVNGRNKFKRYSAEAKGYETIDIYGLVVGVNLPPITDHFHWCRSTITYQWDDWEVIEDIREKGRATK